MHTFQTNSLAAIGQLLQLTGVAYDEQALKDDLLSHPDYPSLFAVHNTLIKYGVENAPVEVDAEHLNELQQPFLAYMQMPGTGSDFAVVSSIHNGTVSYINSRGKIETIKREEFLSKWKNIAVMVEKVNKQKEQQQQLVYLKKTATGIQYAIVAIVLFVILTLTTTLLAATPLLYAPWLLLKMAGLVVTTLLLVYEVDKQNETVKQFCNATKTVNCDAVLQSSGAKIGPFSWSEVGFAYFAGTLLYLLLSSSSADAYFPLAILSLLAFPYTVYSVYYQYKIVKQWCKLCLAVQGIIVLEATLIISAWLSRILSLSANSSWQMPVLLITLLPLPLMAWQLLKPVLRKGTQTDSYKYAYQRLLNDSEVFRAMLMRQKAAPAGYEACSLLIGNPAAKNEIIKVCNPFCGPCAKAHPILEEILYTNPNVKLRIMFNGNNDAANRGGAVAKHFISLYLSKGQLAVKQAMHYWYGSKEKNIEDLKERYSVEEHIDSAAIKEAMNRWQKEAEVTVTPTIYVSGFRLPTTYKTTDLKNVLT